MEKIKSWTTQFDAENEELEMLVSSRSRNLYTLFVVDSGAYWERLWTNLIIVHPMMTTIEQNRAYEPYFLDVKITPSPPAIAPRIHYHKSSLG